MVLTYLGGLVITGVLLTLKNWQFGCFFLIVIAALQDPVRKMTPGVPAYLALASVPIWVTMVTYLLLHCHRFFGSFAEYNPFRREWLTLLSKRDILKVGS